MSTNPYLALGVRPFINCCSVRTMHGGSLMLAKVRAAVDAASRQVELVLPKGVPPEQGLTFLAAQRGWIAARLLALPVPVPFADGAIVPVFASFTSST